MGIIIFIVWLIAWSCAWFFGGYKMAKGKYNQKTEATEDEE